MTDSPLTNWSDEQLLDLLIKGKPPTAAERATDVAKSTGRGVADFATGTLGLPGDVQALAEVGAAKVSGKSPQDFRSMMDRNMQGVRVPTSADLQKKVEEWTGPFYEPQTTEGRYARSIGAYAPAALTGPVKTLPGRLLRMSAVPGAASEFVGDTLKGSPLEAPGRVAAALVSPTAVGRMINPLPISSQRQGYVDLLRDEGVPLTAGQITGRKSLQVTESALGNLPFAGSRLSNVTEGQKGKFVEAALARVLPKDDQDWVNAVRASRPEFKGASDAEILGMRNELNAATPETLGVGRSYATGKLQNAAENTVLQFKPSQQEAIQNWSERLLAAGMPKDVENGLLQMARNYVRGHVTGKPGAPAQLKGDVYQNLTEYASDLSAKQRDGGQQAKYANELRDIIENARKEAAFGKGTREGTGRRQAYYDMDEGRRAYKDVLALENAAGRGEGGAFSPAQLKASLRGQDRQGYDRGRGDLRDLAEAGDVVMKAVPDSGTAGRVYSQALPASLATVLAGAGTGSTALTGAGVLASAAPPLMGRAVMNPLTQWWLSGVGRGQGARRALGSAENERVARLLAAEQATYPYREGSPALPYQQPLALPPP